MINKHNLSKIGIGAWGFGGYAEKDPENNDTKQIDALAYQFKKGMNLTEINFWNSQGQSAQLIKQALGKSGVKRDEVLLIQVIYDYRLETIKDVEKEFQLCLEVFETDYIDSIEFPLTAFDKYGFNNLVELVQKYISKGKARYTSVTNFDLPNLKKYHGIFKDKLFSHELCYSFDVRDAEELGILDYGFENNIINVPYQPLRRNRTATRNWPLLVELSKKYNKTQNQIILNWMTSRNIHPLVKSENIKHINENLDSLKFEMESGDIKRLTDFRVPNYKLQEIDWLMKGDSGNFIHSLPNTFDEIYPKNK
jgi:diketogulonate reductase-like aldo/keto reductase